MRAIRTLFPLLLVPVLVACSREPEPAGVPEAAPTAAESAPAGTARGADAPAAPQADADRLETLVRADDTLATVQQRLGAANAIAETLPGAEGETLSGWILFPTDPTRRLSVYLDDTGEKPLMLLAGEDAIAWTRADGVRIGMTSQELARLNGGSFGFMGFDWDYGGVVTDWRGGRLAPDGASAGPVTLCPPANADGESPADYPSGDSEFGSDDPRVLTNPAWVCEFGVNIDPPAPEAEAPAAG